MERGDETIDSTEMMNLLFCEIFMTDFAESRGFGMEFRFESKNLGYHF
jgi:hypothetical protein